MTTGSALPTLPQSVPHGRSISWLHWFASATACQVACPLYGSDWNAQPSGTFTSRLSTDRSPSPSLDITTTVTGLLCWRDFHPLEWQLASLHGHERPICGRDAMSASPPDSCRRGAWAGDRSGTISDIMLIHSITSSAATRRGCGTLIPSALAVLRLMTNSNLVGCRTGRSAGFSPLRIRPV